MNINIAMPRPKVLVFTKFFWPEGGGGELATHLIVKDIISKFFYVTVISGTGKPEASILEKCRFIYWPMLRTRFKPFEWFKLFLNTKNIVKFIKEADIVYIPSHTLLPLAVVVKKVKPSVKVILHLHNYQPLTYTSVILAGNTPNTKNDIIIERYEHDNIARAVFIGFLQSLNKINVLALHYADYIICVSERQAEIISRYIPKMKPKIRVMYNLTPNTQFPISSKLNTSTLIYSSGDSFIKGFTILVESMREILKKRINTNFKLLGSYSSKTIKILVKMKKIYNSIEILGHIPHKEALKFYAESWALIFPTLCEEPSPYVVVEAMAMGTIPIASKVGGVPEIVKGTYAEKLLFEPGNIDELIDRIEKVLSFSRDQFMDIGAKLRETILNRFDKNIINNQLLEIFTD